MRGFDFSRLRGELVIGVNRAYEVFDPAFTFSMDTRFLRWVLDGALGGDATATFHKILATKIWLHEWSPAKPFPDDVLFIRPGHEDVFHGDLSKPFCRSCNSGFGALNLAACLGADPIYLMGYDMGPQKAQGWWHSGYPRENPPDVYDRFLALFEKHAPVISSMANVVNLNPDSNLRCFQFSTLEAVLAETPTPVRPLVVSFYTRGTGYEAEAKRMVQTAHQMGLETDVEPLETLGGWTANTYFKAQFLRRKLDEHKGRPIVWLDADVEVRAYPAILDNLPADIAVNIVDWSRYRTVRKANRELNTSVVYLGNTNGSRAILDAWIAHNHAMRATGRWEQKNLQDVLERMAPDLNVAYLPDRYCQIFDLMAQAGNPVIELHQASRTLKAEVGE